MSYLHETPHPTIHCIIPPEVEEDYNFDFGVFLMGKDKIRAPEPLRHRPGLPSCSEYGFGVNLLGQCPECRDERNDPPSEPQRRADEAVFLTGKPHKVERRACAALYQEFWEDNMDNDQELEFSSSYLLSSAPGRAVHLTCHRARWVIYKEGQGITANEAVALRNAAKQGLPVPRVFCREKFYAAFDGDEDMYSIKMSFIPGQPLTKSWNTLTHEERVNVFTQVRNLLLRLAVPEDAPGFIGSCDGEDVRDSRHVNTYFGPICSDERAFNRYLISTLAKAPTDTRREYARKLNRRRHRIVFCHGDLSPDNIIVNENMRVTGLLDWEDAGYYPECWENIKFYSRPEMVPEWHQYGKFILPNLFEDEVRDFLAVQKYQLP